MSALSDFTSDQLLAEVLRRKDQAERDIETGRRAMQILKCMVATPTQMEKIIEVACVHFGRTREEIVSKSRHAELVKARHCVIYAAYTQFGVTRCEIARYFGQDHATIHHAVNAVRHRAERDKPFNDDLNEFLNSLK